MLSRSSIGMMAKVELVPRLLVQPPVLSRIFTRFLYVMYVTNIDTTISHNLSGLVILVHLLHNYVIHSRYKHKHKHKDK